MQPKTNILQALRPWLVVFVIGICLPIFGMTLAAQAKGPEDPGPDTQRGIHGIVNAMPDPGPVGTWVISGTNYTVTADTKIEEEFGAIAVGTCVEIHVAADGSTATKLERTRDVECTHSGDDHGQPGDPSVPHGELFGDIVSFPQDLIGDWVIGNVTVTANISTEFSTKNGEFAVGTLVKAEFVVNDDGSFTATEIKTAITPDGGDDNHHGEGEHHGDHDGKVFGAIDALPDSGLLGLWTIDGITYTVTSETELNNHKGDFAVGQKVKVEYTLDADGNRVATEIKSMPAGAGGPEDSTMVGTVEAMPASGFVGDWTISGQTFVADKTSQFKEDNGILAKGAYVKVEYVVVDGKHLIRELETEVPPGAGDDNEVGKVDDMGNDSLAAAAVGNTTWTIGGRSYTVTPSTKVASDLSVSSLAFVNSYAAADGTQVATRISSLAQGNVLYLPVTMK